LGGKKPGETQKQPENSEIGAQKKPENPGEVAAHTGKNYLGTTHGKGTREYPQAPEDEPKKNRG